MDRRADPADVAHVGRCRRGVDARSTIPCAAMFARNRSARRRCSSSSSRRPRTRPRRSCRSRARRASHIARKRSRIDLVVRLVGAAEHEPADGAVRDDVRGRAALEDDPVDARVGWSCWRHRPIEVNSSDQRIERVLALHGSDAACAWSPVNDDVDVLRSERVALDVVLVAWVDTAGRRRAPRTGRRRS